MKTNEIRNYRTQYVLKKLLLVLVLLTVPMAAQTDDIKINGWQLKAYLCALGIDVEKNCKPPPKPKCQWKPCGK